MHHANQATVNSFLGHGHWTANTHEHTVEKEPNKLKQSDMFNCPQPHPTKTHEKKNDDTSRSWRTYTSEPRRGIPKRGEPIQGSPRQDTTKQNSTNVQQFQPPRHEWSLARQVITSKPRTCEWHFVLQLPSNALASHTTCYNFWSSALQVNLGRQSNTWPPKTIQLWTMQLNDKKSEREREKRLMS